MTRLLFYIFYSFRYIYWALVEFSVAFGKPLRVQGTVESATCQSSDMGLDEVRVRYKYMVRSQTYIGSFTRECSQRNSSAVLQRFPVGRIVSVHVDEDRPDRSYLPSGLGYVGPLLAIIPATALLIVWAWWVHFRIVHSHQFVQALTSPPQIQAAECPKGLPGTPESAAKGSPRNIEEEMVPFMSEKGEFSVLFPVSPQHVNTENTPTAYGPLVLHRLTAETPDGLYEVAYGDVPGHGPIQIASWLASSGDVRLQDQTLIDRHKIKLDGIPGSAYTAAGTRYYWSERIYFVGRRFYRITVFFPVSSCTWPSNAAAFLNSFHTTHSQQQE